MQDTRWGGSYPSAEVQSVYSTAQPAEQDKLLLLYTIFESETKKNITFLFVQFLAVSWVPCILRHPVYSSWRPVLEYQDYLLCRGGKTPQKTKQKKKNFSRYDAKLNLIVQPCSRDLGSEQYHFNIIYS